MSSGEKLLLGHMQCFCYSLDGAHFETLLGIQSPFSLHRTFCVISELAVFPLQKRIKTSVAPNAKFSLFFKAG